MTLYNKWDKEHNLIFITGVILIILLLGSWVSKKAMDSYEYIYFDDYIKGIKEIISWLGLSGKEAREVTRFYNAYNINRFRLVLILPLVYPMIILFGVKFKKTLCCLSALVNVVLTGIFIFMGFGRWNIRIWFFLILSILFFLICTMSKEIKSEVPFQPTQTNVPSSGGSKFCTSCGAVMDANAKFCPKCGKS